MVFPQHGTSMYKKPQMRVVNNAPMKVEQINKPVGSIYHPPEKNRAVDETK